MNKILKIGASTVGTVSTLDIQISPQRKLQSLIVPNFLIHSDSFINTFYGYLLSVTGISSISKNHLSDQISILPDSANIIINFHTDMAAMLINIDGMTAIQQVILLPAYTERIELKYHNISIQDYSSFEDALYSGHFRLYDKSVNTFQKNTLIFHSRLNAVLPA